MLCLQVSTTASNTGAWKVYAELDADDVSAGNRVVLQLPLDPASTVETNVAVGKRSSGLRALLSRRRLKTVFHESYDPVCLLSFSGSLFGLSDLELLTQIRLWPSPECEKLYQEMIVGAMSLTPSESSATSTS